MAVFMDTGGGDIYAGPTKEACIEAMQADCSDIDLSEVFEVSGSTKVRASDENDEATDELVTLDEEYVSDAIKDGYCIASENC